MTNIIRAIILACIILALPFGIFAVYGWWACQLITWQRVVILRQRRYRP